MRSRIILSFLIASSLLASIAPASAKVFQLGSGSVDLPEVTPLVEVYYRAMRFNRASNQWNFELTVRNTAVTPLSGAVVVLMDITTNTSGAIAPDGHDEQGKAWYDCSALIPAGGLATGMESTARTLALGMAGVVPQIAPRVFASASTTGTSLAFVRTLNEFGQPLPSVNIAGSGPSGNATNSTDSRFGVATVGFGAGTNWFEFQAEGYLPAWRQQALTAGSVVEIPSPRLLRRGTNVVLVGSGGGLLTNAVGNFRITFPAGAFNGSTTARLTPATAQTLPAKLPAGWSPLQAFWLELTSEPGLPMICQLDLWQPVAANERAVLARWNTTSLQWDVINLVDGLGSAALTVPLAGSGAWVLVVRDSGTPTAPPPQLGQPLQGANSASPDYSQLLVSGAVSPHTSSPSRQAELVTATAFLTVSNALGSLSSGTLLRARVTESYQMLDGATRITPSYETWFTGYERPGSTNSAVLQASLPLRPLLLLGGDELLLGTVSVDILPPTSFAGAVFNTLGGSAGNGSVRVSAKAGMVDQPQALQLAALALTNFQSLTSDAITLIDAFQLTIGRLAPAAQLELQATNTPSNGLFVLTRLLSESGVYGLEPVARLSSDANGHLADLEPAAEPRLARLNGSGQYVLVQVESAQSLVTGIARNSQAQAVPGLIVRLGPWTTVSADDGSYQLLAPAGNVSVALTDPRTGDVSTKAITIPPDQQVVRADLSLTAEGPRVLAVSPADQSTNIPSVASINLSFSKSLNPGTVIGSAVRLLEGGTNAVAATFSLNLRNDEMTFLPVNPLNPQTVYTLVLSTNISDLGGLGLSGPNRFSFATAAAPFSRDLGAQLIVYEPTNGVVWMRGTPGFSQPRQPVVLVNEASGRTTSVLAEPDGSFAGPMPAGADDALSVTVVNGNGSRDTITPSRKIYSDGGIGLFHSGGTIIVAGENGPIDFVIEPGAIASQTKLKLDSVPLTNVLTLVSNVQPESGRILGGFKFAAIQGSPLSQRIEVSFPVKLTDLQLRTGVDPTNCAYGLAIARVVDGQQVFELVDRMHFENGHLVTHSPPFFGLLGPFEDILVIPLLLFTGDTGLTVNGKVYAVQVDTGTGKPAPGASKEYLANALVSGHQASSVGQLQGRLRPGSVFTSSGKDGSYTLLVSVNPFDPSRSTAVTASHPRFPGVTPSTAIPGLDPAQRLAIGDVLLGTDVYFPLRAFAQRAPPVIAVSQAPDQPAVGTNVTLTILSTDNDSTPSIGVTTDSVVSLVPGVTAVPADASVGLVSSETPAPRARRDTYQVASSKAAQVVLLIQSIDTDGNKTEQFYPLLFGAIQPPITNNIPVADPGDHSGPYVIASQPSSGSSGLAPGDAIVLQFNKPISQEVLSQASLLSLAPPAGSPQLAISPNQTFLTVTYPLLIPGSNYTFSIHNIKDLSGNLLDQDPTLPGAQGFSLAFSMAPLLSGRLVDSGVASPETITSAGAVIRGNYAYVLERRGSANSRLAAFDLSNPSAPILAGAYDFPPFARDLVLIPQYSFAWTNPAFSRLPPTVGMFTNILKKDLIGIVGGLAGAGQLQWMRIVDISNPATPKRLAGAVVGASAGMTLPIRIKWSPPTLAYLEAGQPSTVSLVNLQEFLIGEVLVANQAEYVQLPDHGRPGLDLNNDGDYVDPGEVLPLPAKYPLDFAGKDALFGVFDTDQAINDFALDNGGKYVGAVLDAGYLMGTNGLGIHDAAHAVLPAYRSIFSSGLQLDRTNASYSFSRGVPRRVTTLFQYPLIISNQIVRLDLAVVGVRGVSSNWVSVLDVTDRLGIKLLTEVDLPVVKGSTNVYSLERRDDGLLVVASDAHSFLIDPAKFNASPTTGMHPALVGVLPGLGGGANTFDSTELGVHVTAGPDGNATVLQTAPKMRYVSFPSVTPFSPANLVGKSDAELADRLAKASPQDFLLPSRFRGSDGCSVGTITNLDPTIHYYVLIEAPGGSGPTLDLALESLNRSGSPLRKRGFLFPPVHAFSTATLQSLLQTPSNEDASVRAGRAWRLSNDRSSKFFNFYLSRPIVLVAEEMSKTDLAAVDAQLERDVLWSGSILRASFDPGEGSGAPLALFAGKVDGADREYKPGVEAVAAAFPADYLQSPNPGPVAGAMSVPLAFNTLATQSSEITYEAMDLQLAGRRLGIHFKRSYSGQGLFAGPFGRGWDFNYNQRITELDRAVPPGGCFPQVLRANAQDSEVAANRDLLFYTGGGRIVIFKYSGSTPPPEIANDPLVQQLGWLPKAASYYLPPPGLFTTMFRFKDGSFARLEPDGTRYWYDSLGRLVRIYDRFEQNSLQFIYNKRGDLARIDDELGRPLDIGYYRVASDPTFRPDVDVATTNPGALGKIARLQDYSHRDVQYQYTEDGLLDQRLGPQIDSVALPESFTGRQVTRYLYSDSNDPQRSGKSLVGVIGDDSSGGPFLAATELGKKGRDTVSKMLIGGKTLVIQQDHANTARALSLNGGKVTLTQADNSQSAFLLDYLGRVTNSAYSGVNAPTLTTSSEYYTNGLLKAVTYPEGNRIEYYYNEANPSLRSRGNVVRVRRLPGPRGGPVLEATSQFDSWYNLPAGPKTDFNTNTATITLRSDHKDTEFVDSAGGREEFRDNDFGQMVYFKTIDGVVQQWQYREDTGFLEWTSLGDDRVQYSYAPKTTGSSAPEQLGYATALLTPNKVIKNNTYDERGKLIREERAGLLIERAFDASGRLIKTVTTVDQGKKIIQEWAYNQLGFLLTNTVRNVELGAQIQDLVTTFVPDDLNRVKETLFPAGDHHILSYDHLGRVMSYVVEGVYGETYAYDGNGNLTNRFNGVGRQSFHYDGHDRLVGTTLPNGTSVQQQLDGNGNILVRSATDAQGRLLYYSTNSFDAQNRPVASALQSDAGMALSANTYDPGNHRLIVRDALGATLTNWFDASGRLAGSAGPTVTVTNAYDGENNLRFRTTILENGSFREEFQYDALSYATNHVDALGNPEGSVVGLDGRVLQLRDKEGEVVTNTYTVLGEKLSESDPNGVKLEFGYDINRKLATVSDARGQSARNSFDFAGRLTGEALPDGAVNSYTNFTPLTAPGSAKLARNISVALKYDSMGNVTNRQVTGPTDSRIETYSYDGLQRAKRIQDPNGFVEFDYDLLGPWKQMRQGYTFLSNPPSPAQLQFSLAVGLDAGGFRSNLVLPFNQQTNFYVRDVSGRLLSLTTSSSEPIVSSTTYAGPDAVQKRVLGNARVQLDIAYDGNQRVITRRYKRSTDGQVLADMRYAYDRNAVIVARQDVHRGGRADLFGYDPGYRIQRADYDAHPTLGAEQKARTLPGFSVPVPLQGQWAPGTYARQVAYNEVDLLTSISVANPDSLEVPAVASSFSDGDSLLFQPTVDGFVRARDEVGNVTRARLLVRLPGQSSPGLVAASLKYDLLGRLASAERDDGVTVLNEYDAQGNRIRRRVSGDPTKCVPSDVAFIYDGRTLLEERDLAHNGALLARFYYLDGAPVAADADYSGAGTLRRYYFLTDQLGSVRVITDAAGTVLERVNYEAWGQPLIQSADAKAPRVSRVLRDGSDLVLVFSEPVLPPLVNDGSVTNLLPTFKNLGSLIAADRGGTAISGTAVLEESFAGMPFSTCVRFKPTGTLSGLINLQIAAGGLTDEWGNPNPTETLTVSLGQSGNILYTGPDPGSTAPISIPRSAIGFSLLMHGQVFDFDTGLLYCKSRYYDPYTAAFLQRDPEGYADSVNQYAAFAHNPVNMTDRSGTVAADYADSVRKFGERAADRFGFPGRIVNTISKGVGWLLELGTEASQGWDLLESDRQGSFGLIDRMQGAQMLVDEGNKILMVGMILHAAGGMIASKAEGYLSAAAHREIDGARRASRELFTYHEESRSYSQAISDLKRMGGFHEIESEAAVYASENTGVAAHARYNEKKAQVRYARVSEGFEGKPGYLGVKVDEGTGLAEHTVSGGPVRYGVDNETGKIVEVPKYSKTRQFTSDVDFYAFSKGDRLANANEVAAWDNAFRSRFEQLKLERGMPQLQYPKRHPSQLELAESFGRMSGGKKVNIKLIKKVGEVTANSTVLTISPNGAVSRAEDAYLNGLLDQAEVRLKQLQKRYGEEPIGFIGPWRHGLKPQ